MWSPLRAFALGLVLLGTAACGFQPLYGTANRSQAVPGALAGITISDIAGRDGQILRNALLDLLPRAGAPPRYRLDVRVEAEKEGLAVQQDETFTRFNLKGSAFYSLSEMVDGVRTPRTGSKVTTVVAFNVVESEFATLSAEKDATDRAMRFLAQSIETRLALHFDRAR